jgi:hypothetical protein
MKQIADARVHRVHRADFTITALAVLTTNSVALASDGARSQSLPTPVPWKHWAPMCAERRPNRASTPMDPRSESKTATASRPRGRRRGDRARRVRRQDRPRSGDGETVIDEFVIGLG